MQKASVSLSVLNQLPDFIKENSPQFEAFLSQYYRSQEKVSGPIGVVNNLTDYFNLSKYDLTKLDGNTVLINNISDTITNIEVETTDGFVDTNGTILINDEVIYYESLKKSPNVILSSGISYQEYTKKILELSNPYLLFDGVRDSFPLRLNNVPVFPPSPDHLSVKVYNQYLRPGIDFTVLADQIVFTNPPRTFDPINLSDSSNDIQINYLKGFNEYAINVMDTLTPSGIGEAPKYIFKLKNNNQAYYPASTILTVVIVDNELKLPFVDYSIFEDSIIFKSLPTESIYVSYINAAVNTVGAGAQAYSVVNDFGQIDKIIVKDGGRGYTLANSPKVTISGTVGSYATAKALVGGIKTITLIEGGNGYSEQNPPIVTITNPTQEGSIVTIASATVNSDGHITAISLDNSGSGYDFIPRIQFTNPFGGNLGSAVISNGAIQSIPVLDGGFGYSNPPEIYIDPPSGDPGIQAIAKAVLNNEGNIISVDIITGGIGYSSSNPPRIRVIEPTGAQILDVGVDDFGRVINIELLTGGFGYSDVPSVYIVDDRKDNVGNSFGGTGAKAIATIFNGQIIDINITDFGTGYSAEYPPKVYISTPPGAKASCEIGEDEVTGFEIVNAGSNYVKSQFINCARGVSGVVGYDSNNNVIFKPESKSIAASHPSGSIIKSVDSIFLKKVLDRIAEQYLSDIPELDSNVLNIPNVLSTIKDFYASKGTIYSIKYLFKLLYGASVDVSYPKDQMIKPSAATWSVDTVLRSRVISGDPINLKDSVLEQIEDDVDFNVNYARALIENYTAIQTSDFDVYELIVSEETIEGKFVIPYSSRLIESLTPESVIIDVDSTIGWPERNGEIIIGSEIIRYKEKSLTQFIECTRGINDTVAQSWDAGTICSSNFYVYANRGTSREVILTILGIVDANQTTLIDDGSYYLSGDKLSISKLGTDDTSKLVTSWLYNVKKLLKVESITFGGVNDQTATVTCSDPHGLLVGDQVTIYGANPIVYNGSFLVSSRESSLVFKYTLPQPAVLNPQGNILISIDLNRGKSDSQSINTAVSRFPSNIQNTFVNTTDVYVASSGIPNYKIGPFLGTALLPGNQRKLYKFPRIPNTISLKTTTVPGPIGSFINGVSIWNYKSEQTYQYGPLTKINITNPGKLYDGSTPPIMSFSGGGGTGADAEVIIDGSVVDIEVLTGGSGYTSSPLVSIYGSAGIGSSATAIITNGVVSRILINTVGNGYTSEPIVTITGGGGTGATARAVVRGPIKDVNILNAGSSYTSPPSIKLSSGSGAAAQAYVSNGRISSIAIISAGSGYTTAPKVIISGDGFGAVAKAIISTEGSDVGRVISIQILNRGIGYSTGTTQIRLESIGEGAEFSTEISQWTFNLNETTAFDYANGSIFEGFNNQFGGEYAHISNPKQLRYVLGDNLDLVNGELIERESVVHSPILGWSFDGHPIYGPYGLNDPTLLSSNIVPIRSSYRLKTNLIYNINTNPNPYRIEGPSLVEYPAGTFVEDYEYTFNSLATYLDEYNGRYTKTPEFPDGTYAYFVTLDTAGISEFPYIMGPKFYSVPVAWNLNQFAIQSNIPTGVVRYRTPFENVDIDVERTPNESTNALTLENGELLLFEIEDENKDGIISQDEIDDPDIMFEENKLEIFDYFPKINISSKVDIEVETTTKFENAKVTGFLIENSGQNYQVNDRLVFDDSGTEGYGASARISEIQGETITSYSYEYNSTLDVFKGVVQTTNPHNLVVGDVVNMITTPSMEPTSKTIPVRSLRGIEKITVDQEGIGYDPENPPVIQIESTTGQYAELIPTISSSGIISQIDIKNSGDGYTQDPIIRIQHPQSRKKADYFYTTHSEDINLVINNSIVSEVDKSVYIVGRSKTSDNNNHGIIQKLNGEGSLIWSKSLSSTQPGFGFRYCELTSVYKSGNEIYVVGITKPNPSLSDTFNPDIVIAKYTENAGGTSATLTWQREMAGISGISRADYATDITAVGNNFVICGYTNTNTTSVFDGFLIYINSSGDVISKRKLTSNTLSEKLYQIEVDSNNNIYVVGNAGSDNILVSKLYVSANKLLVSWTKQISLTSYKFDNISIAIDEYNQIYVVSTAEVISTGSRSKIYVIRLNASGNIIKSNLYTISGGVSVTSGKCSIDVFGDINFSYSIQESNLSKTVGIVKIDYDGNILNSTKITSGNLIRGYETSLCISDVSGDPLVFGQVYDNRTQFLFNAESSYDDVTERVADLITTGGVTIVTDPKYGTTAYNIPLLGRIRAVTSITSSSWTLEGWFKYTSATTTKILNAITVTDGSNNIIIQINSVTGSNYGKIRTELNGSAGAWSTQSDVVTLMNAGYAHIALTKSFTNSIATYTVYVNGTQYLQRTSSTNINPTQTDFGNITGTLSNPMRVDDIRLSNYVVSYSGSGPTSGHPVVDYGQASGFIFKTDKNVDAERVGTISLDGHAYTISRSVYGSVTKSIDSNPIASTYAIGSEGLQILDFNYAISALTQDFAIPTVISDLWSSRTATIPTVGGSKVKVSARALDKFYFNHFATNKVDNIRKLTINQSFDLNVGTTLLLKNSVGATIASGKILEKNINDNYVLVSDITGTFSINTGELSTSDNFVNEITAYSFANIDNTTPGTFNISIPGGLESKFKPYSDDDYLVRIDATLTGSSYVVGSVVSLTSSNFSFNSSFTSIIISGLTGVTQISLVTNLSKILQVDTIDNTDLVFVRAATSHYLTTSSVVYVFTTPTYTPLTGTFDIYTVLSKKEFIVKLRDVATSFLTNQSITIFVKNPIFKFIYGQQYTFDTSHPSMQGRYLSFYRDNLYKIEYTFKNIVRRGVPGFDEPGNSPFISFKVTDDAANISYYADPSDLTPDGPVDNASYIDVQPSPYIGTFIISDLAGGTITSGPNRFKFVIDFEPEKIAATSLSSYSTTSTKAVGSISKIRLVNGGGFYKKLPIVSDIASARKIERVDIINSGTEYEPGEYFGVPILGDGTGGKVSILVDGTSDPAGQIVEVTVTDPGKGYTTAFIDVDAVGGILGPTLEGSGAELQVVIPPKGSGASIFTKGTNVGKIKKLKNNNFGFNYTHDYTLRPEITFPVNLQLVNTSILSTIKVIDPGTGYTTPPEVVIEGGGGSGAIAQALLKNGRISDIIIKNPGSGYSTAPSVALKSSFTYVVNLDLGLFQFSFPHGIQNGVEVTFTIQDIGEGSIFPLTSFGYIDADQIYYAISGTSAGLEDDQLRIALTPQDAISGNYISFVNGGAGRQIILTSSFGGSAAAVVETGRFLSGELVYQGESLINATATGYVSTNDGWQIGPRVLKVTSVDGNFERGQQVSGVVSRASGTITDLSIAKGVLEVNSITNTVGKFLDDVGKPSEIVQKIQDSYLYQAFSYNVKSPVSIDGWRDTLINTTHPAGFKVFGEIDISGGGKGLTDKTDFELTKSVNLIESSVVADIENFALVEPVYEDFDNTQVLFRSKRLTSSEEILTSVVQKLDDISPLFDGERTTFPLTINGEVVIANTSQFMIVINGISQAPGTSFIVQQGNIVFFEPPQAPTKISYAELQLTFESSSTLSISNVSGILPELGNTIRGLTSNAIATVISSTTSSLVVFNTVGTFVDDEILISTATGLNCTLETQSVNSNDNIFEFKEKITNISGKTAVVEEINLDKNTNIVTNSIVISKSSGTYDSPSGLLKIELNNYIVSAKSGVIAKVIGISPYEDPETGVFVSSINISDPSTFFGLLFNRIVNPVNPNTIVDDLSRSLIEVSSLDDTDIKVESNFVPFEEVGNIILDFDYNSGLIQNNDLIQNISIDYINENGDFTIGEEISTKKLSYHTLAGGNFQIGNTITGISATATVIGINYAFKVLYLGQQSGTFVLEETITNGSGVSAKVSNYIKTPFIANQIDSATNNILTGQFDTDDRHRFRDAANLLRLNSTYIVDESAGRLKNRYSDLNIPGDTALSLDGTNRCKLDLSLLLNAVADDLEDGGNYNTVTAAKFYLNADGGLEYIRLQALQSLYAHTQMSLLCQDAVSGDLSYTPTYTNQIPVPPTDVIVDGGGCANVKSAIESLWNVINDIIAPTGNVYRDAGDLLWFNKEFIAQEATGYIESYFAYTLNGVNYSAFNYPDGSPTICERDITDYIIPSIITDLITGGNSNTISAMEFYVGNGDIEYVKDELLPTIIAFEKVNELCQYAIDNWIITGTSSEYFSLYGATAPKYKDLTILPDTGTYGGDCATVKSAIDTLFDSAVSILQPGSNLQRNAAKLLLYNKEYIKFESLQRTLNNYPTFTVPGGNSKCLRDIGYIVDAIVYDLLTNGNSGIVNATLTYIDATTGTVTSLQGELVQSIYAYNQVKTLMKQAIAETLTSPSSAASQYAYTDSNISITGSNLTSMQNFVDSRMEILLGVLNDSNYIETNSIIASNSIDIPSKTYPVRSPITPITGRISVGDYIYGASSAKNAEVEQIIFNRARVKDILKRFEIEYDVESEIFALADELTIPGQTSNTCIIESVENGEFVSYIDVRIVGGSFSVSNVLINDAGFTATIQDITNRVQLIDLIGQFDNNQYAKGLYSGSSLDIQNFEYNISPVLSNTGGRLVLETESLQGEFITTRKVYSSISSKYIDVIQDSTFGVDIGDIIQTQYIYKLTINYDPDADTFPIGSTILNSINFANSSSILGYDIINSSSAYIYVGNIAGSLYTSGTILYYYAAPADQFPSGIGQITNVSVISSEGYATVQKVTSIGNYKRLYLSNVVGEINQYSQIISNNDYRSAVVNSIDIVGRISRSFLGFDGQQTEFKLTSNNGDQYFPDSDGHILVYVNGILQPPGSSYTVFSDIIEFAEAPELGASFHAVYVGKLRQLDDISFDFDSLKSSFNLKLNEVFYSLTITSGVQSTTIKPENNIIVSLNGVIQEPGVAFELVGSRIIFAEVPRAGSTFVAFSYIGSDADVIAAEIIPPIEAGDVLQIEGEDLDRTVAVIESSNSLITFDYLGSVLGRNAQALTDITVGRVNNIQLTSGGDGYTSRPSVSFDSPTGFDAQAKALVGIGRVEVINRGVGYSYPTVVINNNVPD